MAAVLRGLGCPSVGVIGETIPRALPVPAHDEKLGLSGRSLARQKRQSGGLENAGSNPAVLTTLFLSRECFVNTEGKFAGSEDRLERDSRGNA